MIKFENYEVVGWEHAIRGMRNPKNSWERSDSDFVFDNGSFEDVVVIGPNDHELMMKLANGGPVHAKYRRMITVYVDITAPLYWWKEFDTYKVGTVANSCSTMHKIHERDLTIDDFSHEHLNNDSTICLAHTIDIINLYRNKFMTLDAKNYWNQMIQLLPSSYNQKRTVMMNYEVLAGIYPHRKNHKLDEWHRFCDFIESLPYSEIITTKN
jgi:hypothetical protein